MLYLKIIGKLLTRHIMWTTEEFLKLCDDNKVTDIKSYIKKGWHEEEFVFYKLSLENVKKVRRINDLFYDKRKKSDYEFTRNEKSDLLFDISLISTDEGILKHETLERLKFYSFIIDICQIIQGLKMRNVDVHHILDDATVKFQLERSKL